MIINSMYFFSGDRNEYSDGEIISPTGKSDFFVREGVIYGPRNDALYSIEEDGTIRGPEFDELYQFQDGYLCGPDTNPPFARGGGGGGATKPTSTRRVAASRRTRGRTRG